MKKRIVSFLMAAVLLLTLTVPAGAYSTDYPNTHVNTGDQRSDIVKIAETQVGYPENDGTKYGAWWQQVQNTSYDFIHEAWCVMFVHWCLDQAGCTNGYSGLSALSSALLDQYRNGKNGNTAYAFGSGYMPRPGDIVFIGSSSGSYVYTDHVGLVTSVTEDTIYTIEGNYSDMVSRSSYSLSDGTRTGSVRKIVYFGVPAYANDTTTPDFSGPTTEDPDQPDGSDTGIYYETLVKTGLNVRTSPSTSAMVIRSLNTGDVVTIVDEADGDNGYKWGLLSSGGWICLYYTSAGGSGTTGGSSETPSETPDTTPVSVPYNATVSCDVLNVRTGSNTGCAVIGSLYRGDRVTIVAATTSADGLAWGELSTGGWIATKYLTKDAAAPSDPDETPDEIPDETPSETPDEAPSETITGTVTASALNIRSTPGTGNVVGTYYRGESVSITETQTVSGTSWGKTSKGWISMDYVSAASSGDSGAAETPSGGTACTVTSDVVNVRSGAGTSNAVLTTVTRGASITIVETATVSGALWGRMTTGGWICLQYTSYSSGQQAPSETPSETPSGDSGSGATTGTVTASALNIRSTPGTGSVIGTYYKGQSVSVTETQTVNGALWGKTSQGWISMDYVSSSGGGSSSGTSYTVTGSVVNIRAGAGMDSAVTSTVTKGASVTIVATASASGMSWGQLSSGGWICMDYVA